MNRQALFGLSAVTWVAAACGLILACRSETPSQQSTTDVSTALALPEGAEIAASGITNEDLAAHIVAISADETEGRSPGTAGDRLARQYLAATMASYGLQPAFDGEWEQPVEMLKLNSETPEQWRFQAHSGSVDLKYWEDFVAVSGVQELRASLEEEELVFVGYGIQAPEYGWDDFKGQDVSGKVLLMLNNDPDWDPELFEGNRRLYYGRWDYKYESAAAQGAAGAIIIHTPKSAGYPWQVVQNGWSGSQFEVPEQGEAVVQVEGWITEEAARRVVALAGQDLDSLVELARGRDFQPVALGVSTSIELKTTVSSATSANVGGLIPGSDPQLREQVVIYTAHHDHMGIGEPDETGDSIYNGALDNASGCAQILSVAKAFMQLPQPPSRSILFLFVAAEEQGLLGSQHFAQNPSFPPGQIAANINLDNAKNIWGPTRDVTFIGYGKSSLDAIVEAAAARQDRVVKPDQLPDRGFFYRSDQFNLAKIGVPAVYLDAGTDFIDRPAGWGRAQIEEWEAKHYHRPSDQFDESWVLDAIVQDAVLAFEIGLAVSEANDLPSWYPGDEFEAARLAALEALN